MPSLNLGSGIEVKLPDGVDLSGWNLGGKDEEEKPQVPMLTPEAATQAGEDADDLIRPRSPETARQWAEMKGETENKFRNKLLDGNYKYTKSIEGLRQDGRDNDVRRTKELSDNYTTNLLRSIEPSIELERYAQQGLNDRYKLGVEFGRNRLSSIERMHEQSIGATNQANTLNMLGRLVSVGGLLAAMG